MRDFFDILNNFYQQHNETIKSIQCCKLSREDGEDAEEWIGRLRIAVAECNYKEIDLQLKEQLIHSLNDKEILTKIIPGLTDIKDTNPVTSEQVIALDQ